MDKKAFIKTFTFTLVITFVILTILSPNKVYSNKPIDYLEIMVHRGDSLWSIARKHNTSKKDIRELIYQIEQLNDSNSASLHPGDILKIPIFED